MLSTKPDAPVSALIGLGGNVGDVAASMRRALDAIDANESCAIAAVSNIYRTPPWGITDQAWFFNACAEVETMLDAEALLDLLLRIEIAEGRVRDVRWGPRTLDLDIIAYGDASIETDRLSVPHPRMGERAFVIVPLMDIAADRMVGGRTIKDYTAGLDRGGIEIVDEKLR